MIVKIPGIQNRKVPGHIEMFCDTGIKYKSKVKLSCITYKDTKFYSHDFNKN